MNPLSASRAYIALGANLADPVTQLQAALARLQQIPGITLAQCSSFYRTAPIGLAGQPDFINAVAALNTTLSPLQLLTTLLQVEQEFGRVRLQKNGPRTLDLDLLLYDDLVLTYREPSEPELILPHPRLHLRAFVLVPLAEIAPDLPLPERGSVTAWLPAVANQDIHKLA